MIFLYFIGIPFILITAFILYIISIILYVIILPFKICIIFITYLQEKITIFGINILYQYKKRHK